MKKIYVLDTNVLLHDPNAIFSFQDNEVVIPLVVIEEVDGQKRRQDEVGRHGRLVAHHLDQLRLQGKLSEGVTLRHGGKLRVQLKHDSPLHLPEDLDPNKADNQVIGLTLQLKAENPEVPVILVSKDINVRVKADALNLVAEDYETDKVVLKDEDLYDGMMTLQVPPEEIEVFTKTSVYTPQNGRIYCNQFVHFKSLNGTKSSALGRFDAETRQVVALAPIKKDIWGIQPKNLGQRFAFDILLDERIPLVTMTGQAGTGKTLLALAAGLHKVLDQHRYRRLLVTRPVIPMGKDVGYLPGDKDEKLRPWMQPIYDNLEYLMGGIYKEQMAADMIRHIQEKGIFEAEALTYIRGRSIPQQFIIVDEAQNLTPHEVKTIVSRAGEGTKIVLTGDPNQIDHPYLDFRSNGLCYAVEKFKDNPLAGHVTLTKGQRSELAELAAKLL
ncbi:MAG TPA: PhoH family protein [Candidatus Limnocylindrales bacterium]|nr:PhoH family protein [Candidatus Limnocylindrales bacterium]